MNKFETRGDSTDVSAKIDISGTINLCTESHLYEAQMSAENLSSDHGFCFQDLLFQLIEKVISEHFPVSQALFDKFLVSFDALEVHVF